MFGRLVGTAPERPEDALSMRQYCEDTEKAVAEVREAFPDADSDPAFVKAANALIALSENGKDMEDLWAWELPGRNTRRKELLLELGEGRAPEVSGEPSKMLAGKYRDLMQGLLDKKYWPLESATTYESTYASGFANSTKGMQRVIDTLNDRISTYENQASMKKAI